MPIKNSLALADAIDYLIKNGGAKNGASGRALAEKEFAIEKIVAEHMKICKTFACGGLQ